MGDNSVGADVELFGVLISDPIWGHFFNKETGWIAGPCLDEYPFSETYWDGANVRAWVGQLNWHLFQADILVSLPDDISPALSHCVWKHKIAEYSRRFETQHEAKAWCETMMKLG